MSEKLKKAFQANSFKYGTFSIIISVIVIAIVIGINMCMGLLPAGVTMMDISDNKLYSIGETTEKIVSDVYEDITIYVVGKEENFNEIVLQMLDKYADLTSHIKIQEVDPDLDPTFLNKFSLTSSDLSGNGKFDLIVESSKRFKLIKYTDIYEVDQQEYLAYLYGQSSSYTTKYDGEGEVTSAISYVTSNDLPKMYLLTGHSEIELDTAIATLIDKNNISTEKLNLITAGQVPEDCDILMIYLPQTDFSSAEVEALEKYIAYGGKCVIFNSESALPDMTNYKEFLAYYGVEISEGSYIFEGTSNCVYPKRFWLYEKLGNSSLTSGLSGYALAPLASAITTLDSKRNTLEITPILSTSSDSWLRSDLESKITDEKIDSDVDGPFDFAVSIVDSTNEGQGKLVLFACDYFLELSTLNQYVSNYANGDVLVSVLSSMASLQTSVSIATKSANIQLNTFTAQEKNTSLIICVIIVPVIILITGFVIWMSRRRR